MASMQPRTDRQEIARRGAAIFERSIRPHLSAADHGKYVAIDVDSGAYALDSDDLRATDLVIARNPDAQIWLMRVGHRTAYRIGARAT
jgi:hypothetical protein